ncbi:monosaccharide ABC transporter membrane protein, CUT2 family [Anaerovirgula multivorans]|uniref:Monosaccharide ABC transporter membrane protein, CUT2 family n=1 Tax=Anaerovirgula multivorans TaxID=312168 RepID=A0A239BSC5_9FIRM|nr:ABC transporter permease [Anaerovirgula multivorans]SNS10786.1 monosaccharide ABC transporter membrane protein, CUT2 family [Anaerovirgula multivorans]
MDQNVKLDEIKTKRQMTSDYIFRFIVPIVFIVLCGIGYNLSELQFTFVLNEVITRLARNSFLVISLIIPVIAGMGLNFGIVLGAIAGQIALVFVTDHSLGGLSGLLIAFLVSTPLAIVFGYLVGQVLNRAKGKEMITSMILGFFANGVYQLVFLVFAGTIIPFKTEKLIISTGMGVRNSVDLIGVRQALDNVWKIRPYQGLTVPMSTIIVVGLLCLTLTFFLRTKLGQEMRTVGQNMHIAEVSGINVDRTRITAIIISTVLAAWGQIIFLQNIGTLNTYGSHEQVGLFAVASLLIGGASVTKATYRQALLGTFLFHMLFIISPMAGQNLMGDSQIGEFFRVFVAYGVIGLALLLHAWQKRGKK